MDVPQDVETNQSDDVSEQETIPDPGLIPYCPYQGCGFRCCDFQQGNYIVLYPGELEAAQLRSESTSHLQDLEPYEGGYKAVCKAADTATCDGGYKPLDCKSYPFFPSINEEDGSVDVVLKGGKCPLTADMIPDHRQWVGTEWGRLAERHSDVGQWIAKVRLVGYVAIPRRLKS
jgi:Fe-S-cluster containining protein